MSLFYKPKIVTSGLVLHLDAADPSSYLSPGTVWRDLSGRGNNGTLTNGPIFSAANGGSIVFDGTNDYVRTTSLLLTGNETNLTLSCWYKPENTNTIRCIVSIGNEANGTRRMILQRNANIEANGYFADFTSSNSVLSTNSWCNISIVYTSLTLSSGIKLYFNGKEISGYVSSGTSLNVFTNTICTICGTNATVPTDNAAGNIAQASIYNRALTASEIAQNFQATRGRFGLGPHYVGPISRYIPFVPSAVGVTGELSATLGSVTLSSDGTLANGLSADLTKTLDAATLSSSGTLTEGLSASLSATLGSATLASDATITDGLSGALSKTLDDALVSSDGTLTDGITATLSKTLDDATLSASGAESVGLSGSLSGTLDAATVSADGSLVNGLSGDLTATLGEASVSSSATLADGATGSVSSTLGDCTLSATASFGAGLTAELNAALDAATVSSSGALASGLTANLSVQLASASLAASGVVGTPSTGSNFKINVGGVWKQATPFVNVGGVWKQATPFIKIDGEWK